MAAIPAEVADILIAVAAIAAPVAEIPIKVSLVLATLADILAALLRRFIMADLSRVLP